MLVIAFKGLPTVLVPPVAVIVTVEAPTVLVRVIADIVWVTVATDPEVFVAVIWIEKPD